jgi:hypothetical protein
MKNSKKIHGITRCNTKYYFLYINTLYHFGGMVHKWLDLI